MSEIVVELGNADPNLRSASNPEGDPPLGAPTVTYVHIPVDPDNYPEGHHAYQQVLGTNITGAEIRSHMEQAVLYGKGVTHLPGHEAVVVVANPASGAWRQHTRDGSTKPTWVHAYATMPDQAEQAAEVERLLSEIYECPAGRPADLEDTHHTSYFGVTLTPGEGPHNSDIAAGAAAAEGTDAHMNITQNGRDIQARTAFGGQVGVSGVGSAATGTSVTTGASLTTNAWTGYRAYVADTTNHVIVWGNVQSNGASVVTVDRWYNAATPGGAAATTPAAGFEYILADGGGPSSWFMALSTSVTGLSSPSTNTTLPSEITTSGGGLVRQICPWAHTASTATTTLTPVFTANGSDTLPAVIGSVGTFNSMVVGAVPNMFFNTLLPSTATLATSGDQLTITQTITGT